MTIFIFTKNILEKALYIPNHFDSRYRFHRGRYEDLNFLVKQPSITFGTTFNLMKKYGYILDGGLFNEKLRSLKDFTQQKKIIKKDANTSLTKSLAAKVLSVLAASIAIVITPLLTITIVIDIIHSGVKLYSFYRNKQDTHQAFPGATSDIDKNIKIDNIKPLLFIPKPRRIYKSFSTSMPKSPSIDEDIAITDINDNDLCLKINKTIENITYTALNPKKIRFS